MSLILPPRLEGRAAAEAAMIEIPIYESDDMDSLRPTWLPIDPSTYRPPPKPSRAAAIAKAGKVALLLFATWGVAFASVVAPHVARDFLAKRSAAASPISAARVTAENHANANAPSASVAPAKSGDAITLTVDVMNLPISKATSKDFPPALPPARKVTRRAAGS